MNTQTNKLNFRFLSSREGIDEFLAFTAREGIPAKEQGERLNSLGSGGHDWVMVAATVGGPALAALVRHFRRPNKKFRMVRSDGTSEIFHQNMSLEEVAEHVKAAEQILEMPPDPPKEPGVVRGFAPPDTSEPKK